MCESHNAFKTQRLKYCKLIDDPCELFTYKRDRNPSGEAFLFSAEFLLVTWHLNVQKKLTNLGSASTKRMQTISKPCDKRSHHLAPHMDDSANHNREREVALKNQINCIPLVPAGFLTHARWRKGGFLVA